MSRHTRIAAIVAMLGLIAAVPAFGNSRPALQLESGDSSLSARPYHSTPCIRRSVCAKRPRLSVRPGGYLYLRIGGPVEKVTVQLGRVSTRPYRAIGERRQATFLPTTRSFAAGWRIRLPASLRDVNVLDATVHTDGVKVKHHSMLRVHRR